MTRDLEEAMHAQRELRRKVGRSVLTGRPLDDPADARAADGVIAEQLRNLRRARIPAAVLLVLIAALDVCDSTPMTASCRRWPSRAAPSPGPSG